MGHTKDSSMGKLQMRMYKCGSDEKPMVVG